MLNYDAIINNVYPEAGKLRDILYVHSRGVADMALEICDRHPELGADRELVEAAAMLHDIGIIRCNATGIECYGTEPYICHGTIGAAMLRSMQTDDMPSLEPYARVCERHTGTGLTLAQIESQNLPLPHKDLVPETIEEQIVCYADKFFSKTHPEVRKTYEQAQRSLMKFGEEGVAKFDKWHEKFG